MAIRRQPFKLLYNPVPPFNMSIDNTALLILDVQRFTVDESGGLAKLAREKGIISEFKDFFESVKTMISNIQLILSKCRDLGIRIIFTRLVLTNENVHDTNIQNKARGINKIFSLEDSHFLDNLYPKKNEIIIDKKCDNPFNCTKLEYILRKMGVKYLLICGVLSPGYLNTTALDAADRGLGIVAISDACAGGVRGGTQFLTGGLIRVRSTHSVMEYLSSICDEGDKR